MGVSGGAVVPGGRARPGHAAGVHEDRLPDVVALAGSALRVRSFPGDGVRGPRHAPREHHCGIPLEDLSGGLHRRWPAGRGDRDDLGLAKRGAQKDLSPPGRGRDGTFSEVSSVPFPLLAGTLEPATWTATGPLTSSSRRRARARSRSSWAAALGFAPPRHYLAGQGTNSAVDPRSRQLTTDHCGEPPGRRPSFLPIETSGTLAAPRFFPTGGKAFVPGDVTGDGWTDLVVTGTNGLEVLLGSEDGSYPSVPIHTGEAPTSVAAGDLNGDGIDDLVFSNDFRSTLVGIALSAGGGLFQPVHSVPVGTLQQRVTLADFEQDGHLDLMVTTNEAIWMSGKEMVVRDRAEHRPRPPRHLRCWRLR